jgi:uncharacterized delta-60 repeat protein
MRRYFPLASLGSLLVVLSATAQPVITRQPVSRTNDAGTVAAFSVAATGTGALQYQWVKGVALLSDAGNVSGSTTPTLTLSNVLGSDADAYSVVVADTSGSVTSSVAILAVNDPLILSQPAGLYGVVGGSASFSVTTAGTGPFAYQWRKNGTAVTGATSSSLTLNNLQSGDAANYDVVVANAFGSVTSGVAILNLGYCDAFNPGANSTVYSVIPQPDGKILVGGSFTNLAGQARNSLGRLNSDGSLDLGYNPGVGGSVNALAQQADGKVLVGGTFTILAGANRNQIGRLNPDGSIDPIFNPSANAGINAIALQPDGKIVLGGSFTSMGGVTQNYIARLNADGSLDTSFNPVANSTVYSVTVQPDGKILVGGSFSSLGGQSRNSIGRLNADGSVDATFNPGASGSINTFVVQPDGRILVGGSFSTLGGQSRSRIGRLNSDGSLDAGFNPGAGSTVYSLALQADGKILTGGLFTSLGGTNLSYLGRLNPDGTLDPAFRPQPNSFINTVALQADGKILVGGGFTTLAGLVRNRIARLGNTTLATGSVAFDGSTLTWLRGATAPEFIATGFDVWQGGGWVQAAPLLRTSGGWQAAGLALSPTSTVRLHGWSSGGYYNGSASMQEILMGSLVWTNQPISRTNNAGTAATFYAFAAGASPVYQWFKDGVPLSDTASISGSSSSTLTISNALGGDAGSYTVVATNTFGAVTSSVATLTVLDPCIFAQPLFLYSAVGSNATFAVGAAGTSLTYQWRKDGVPVPGATNSVLQLNNLQIVDAGFYDVVVSGAYGTATSGKAPLNLGYCDSFTLGANGSISAAVPQPDGKILVGGDFSILAGQNMGNIGRLNADGTPDPNFNPSASSAASFTVAAFAVQSDGRIIVGGAFTNLCGVSRKYLGRLNPDGTLDAAFSPLLNFPVCSVALQSDGRILVGSGPHFPYGGSQGALNRFNSDGSMDPSFSSKSNVIVHTIAVQPDGKILAGGYFTALGGQQRNYIGRLNSDGSVDAGFNPGADDVILCIAMQPDGKILLGGGFGRVAGVARGRLARLNPDGTLDAAFNPGANSTTNTRPYVNALALQVDGKIHVGGSFTNLGGMPRNNLGLLNSDGSAVAGFNPAPSDQVLSLALQPDGKILAGGAFTSVGGQHQNRIARLFNTESAAQSLTLTPDGSTITWSRSGSVPEIWRATFETSADGATWNNLPSPQRIAGGWQLSGVNLFQGTPIRARGYATAGSYTGSSTYFESDYGWPWMLTSPVSQTNDVGTTATFMATAAGSDVLQYQWFKDGVLVSDDGNIAGAASSQLTINSSSPVNAGQYFVVVANGFGAVTSAVASLTITAPPVITSQPANCTNNGGTTAFFTVGTAGTGPMFYQWFKAGAALTDGGSISGSAGQTLTLNGVLGTDAGAYAVVITNSFGSVTSSVATLTVILAPPQNFLAQPSADGLSLQFTGSPNYPYILQSTTNLVPPLAWQSVLTNLSGADGSWSYGVTNFQDLPKCFYRVVAW